MAMQIPCKLEFSRGYGTGVAEALGNWGFSNRTCTAGDELQRIIRIFGKMDCLKTVKPRLNVKYNCKYDPEAWLVKPSSERCKPAWTHPENRPLIVYSSTNTLLKVESLESIRPHLPRCAPGRAFIKHGTRKWYRRGPGCCPQPSCLAPQCPQ